MKIAVEGCLHGELDKVYATVRYIEMVDNTKIDLLICCGDFQARTSNHFTIDGQFKKLIDFINPDGLNYPPVGAQSRGLDASALALLAQNVKCWYIFLDEAVRNEDDLESLNCPPKYRSMNSFWKYYSGQEATPVPTIFIGGNHEASNYLWELYYGGWAAPNIYFLGFSGVIKFGNIRIGGLSGIYKQSHYHLGHFERPPYNDSELRSVYHIREYDVMKLKNIKDPIDIFLSHDWPVGIYEYGNVKHLIQHKPYFKEEIEKRTLGSMPAAELLNQLKPNYWFSAHLHCKFSAIVQHMEDNSITKFLALDKCLPRRDFLQIIDIKSDPGPFEIHYDEEWLAITRKFNSLFPLSRKTVYLRSEQLDEQGCRDWVRNKLNSRGAKPFDFVQTVSPFDPSQPRTYPSASVPVTAGHCRNPQTELFLQFLELPYLLDTAEEASTPALHNVTVSSLDACYELPEEDNGEELELPDDENEDAE